MAPAASYAVRRPTRLTVEQVQTLDRMREGTKIVGVTVGGHPIARTPRGSRVVVLPDGRWTLAQEPGK